MKEIAQKAASMGFDEGYLAALENIRKAIKATGSAISMDEELLNVMVQSYKENCKPTN